MALSVLLRRTAIACFPQSGVAGLSGPQWLEFLDRVGNTDRFTRGQGEVLAAAPYQRDFDADVDNLLGLVKRWLDALPSTEAARR